MSKIDKSPKNQTKLKLLFVFPILFLLIVPLILISYFNLYPSFVSVQSQAKLDTIVASIPFIPKSPKQVLTKALVKNQTLTNYHSQLIVKITEEKRDLLVLNISGAIEKALARDSESKVKIVGKLSEPEVSEIDLETQHFRQDFYFKPVKPFQIAEVNFSQLKNQWYKVNLEKFQESLGLTAKNDPEILKDINEQFASSQEKLIKDNLFSKVSKFTKVKKDGQNFYEITFALKEKDSKDFLASLNLKAKSATLKLLINEKNFYLVDGTLEAPLEAKGNTLLLNYKVDKIGENIEVKPMLDAKEIKGAQELNQLIKGGESDQSLQQLFTVSQDTGEVGGSFLTFERLLKVFLLLPKAL